MNDTPHADTAMLLRSNHAEGVTVLTLNRPARRNSLSFAMLQALHAALDAIATDTTVRAVVLAANGPGRWRRFRCATPPQCSPCPPTAPRWAR